MIPINALTVTIFSLMLLALVATTYATVQFFLEHRKFTEPNRLRTNALADVNLDHRANNIYNYLCWHIEDVTQVQPLTQAEAISIATYMVANACEGMDRKETSHVMQQINENARKLKNMTRQPHRNDNVVELTVKKEEVSGDGAQVH